MVKAIPMGRSQNQAEWKEIMMAQVEIRVLALVKPIRLSMDHLINHSIVELLSMEWEKH